MLEKVTQLMNDAKESQRFVLLFVFYFFLRIFFFNFFQHFFNKKIRLMDKQDQELTSFLLDALEKEERIGRELEQQINKIILEVQQRINQIQSQFGSIGIQMK